MRDKRLSVLAACCLLLGILSCSSSNFNYLRNEIANQGPVPLSRDNPYVIPNLFLSKEIQLSPLMGGFIRHRGVPDAVEVRKRWTRAYRLYFFYLEQREAYLFEEAGDSWLIRGPEAIPAELMIEFSNLRVLVGEPALAKETVQPEKMILAGPVDKPQASPPQITQKEVLLNPSPDSAYPLPGQPLQGALPPNNKNKIAESTPRKKTTASSNLTVSSSGDVIHRVSYHGETLRIIASWFTDSADNADRIARINGINDPNVLRLDQSIRIPGYLLKKTDALPKEEVERYLREVDAAAPKH